MQAQICLRLICGTVRRFSVRLRCGTFHGPGILVESARWSRQLNEILGMPKLSLAWGEEIHETWQHDTFDRTNVPAELP